MTFSLQYFMQRTMVLAQYRTMIRLARTLDRDDLAVEVRRQFAANRDVAEPRQVKFMMAEAKKQHKMMEDIANDMLARGPGRGGEAGAGSAGSGVKIQKGEGVGAGWPWKREGAEVRAENSGVMIPPRKDAT